MSRKVRSTVMMAVLAVAAMTNLGCAEELGLCVSTPVDIGGLKVYCYDDDWTQEECAFSNAEQVNGADWFFHANQTCADRDLTSGSNNWP